MFLLYTAEVMESIGKGLNVWMSLLEECAISSSLKSCNEKKKVFKWLILVPSIRPLPPLLWISLSVRFHVITSMQLLWQCENNKKAPSTVVIKMMSQTLVGRYIQSEHCLEQQAIFFLIGFSPNFVQQQLWNEVHCSVKMGFFYRFVPVIVQ